MKKVLMILGVIAGIAHATPVQWEVKLNNPDFTFRTDWTEIGSKCALYTLQSDYLSIKCDSSVGKSSVAYFNIYGNDPSVDKIYYLKISNPAVGNSYAEITYDHLPAHVTNDLSVIPIPTDLCVIPIKKTSGIMTVKLNENQHLSISCEYH